MDLEACKQSGWHLRQDNMESLLKASGVSPCNDVLKLALQTDLKEIGDKCLPDSVHQSKIEHLTGPMVLQVQRVRNVSVLKGQQWNDKNVLKFLLTDGCQFINALNITPIPSLNDRLLPGSKLLLSGRLQVVEGFVLLSASSCKVLGGCVAKLADEHAVKKGLSELKRAEVSSHAPPPFVLFEKRNKARSKTADLMAVQAQKKEAKKLSGAVPTTTLQDVSMDTNVSSLLDMGFSVEASLKALSLNRGDIARAVTFLLEQPSCQDNSSQLPTYPVSTLNKSFVQQTCPIQENSKQQNSTKLHATQQHSPQQHSTQQHSTQQHSTQQHSTQQHSTQQHSTQQHSTQQHSTQQHSTQQHSTQQHSAQSLLHQSTHRPYKSPIDLHKSAQKTLPFHYSVSAQSTSQLQQPYIKQQKSTSQPQNITHQHSPFQPGKLIQQQNQTYPRQKTTQHQTQITNVTQDNNTFKSSLQAPSSDLKAHNRKPEGLISSRASKHTGGQGGGSTKQREITFKHAHLTKSFGEKEEDDYEDEDVDRTHIYDKRNSTKTLPNEQKKNNDGKKNKGEMINDGSQDESGDIGREAGKTSSQALQPKECVNQTFYNQQRFNNNQHFTTNGNTFNKINHKNNNNYKFNHNQSPSITTNNTEKSTHNINYEQRHKQSSQFSTETTGTLIIGDLCMAQWKDGLFYKARVVQVSPELLVDYFQYASVDRIYGQFTLLSSNQLDRAAY